MNSKKNFNIIYANMRSIRNKFDEFEVFCESYPKLDAVILNETWITNFEAKLYNLRNFKAIHNCRDHAQGGGTAIFINKKFKHKILFF